jgi:hypothetical protein
VQIRSLDITDLGDTSRAAAARRPIDGCWQGQMVRRKLQTRLTLLLGPTRISLAFVLQHIGSGGAPRSGDLTWIRLLGDSSAMRHIY